MDDGEDGYILPYPDLNDQVKGLNGFHVENP